MLVFASALAASTDLEARVAALEARLTRDASAHRPEPRTPLFGSATGGTGTLTGTWTDHAAMIACPISGSVESVRTHELALAESEGGSGALRGTLCSSRALNSTYTLQWCEPVVGMLDPPVGDFWLTSKKPTACAATARAVSPTTPNASLQFPVTKPLVPSGICAPGTKATTRSL